jgi:hypothetical protein
MYPDDFIKLVFRVREVYGRPAASGIRPKKKFRRPNLELKSSDFPIFWRFFLSFFYNGVRNLKKIVWIFLNAAQRLIWVGHHWYTLSTIAPYRAARSQIARQKSIFKINIFQKRVVKIKGCLKSGQQISFIWAATLLFFGQQKLFFLGSKIIYLGSKF